jgi:inner membrane protein
MTGPTHVAVAVTIGMISGVSGLPLSFIAGGALVPDIDHPKSIIGRIFLPISIPLNHWLGHRGAFHSFWLWGIVMLAGILWKPIFWIGLGALLHIWADCYTVSGVRAFTPFTEQVFVLFKRDWRIKTGQNTEFIILMILGTIAWSTSKIGTMGGLSAVMGYFTGSPKIMVEEFTRAGLTKCYVKGKFRMKSGRFVEGEWLVIGTHGSGIAFLTPDGKIWNTSDDGKFIRARLRKTDQEWNEATVRGYNQTKHDAYYLSGKKWHTAQSGDLVIGHVISDQISLSSMEDVENDFTEAMKDIDNGRELR